MNKILNMRGRSGIFQPQDGEKILMRAIDNSKMKSEWRTINAVWPDAYDVCLNLSTYLLDIPKADNGKPLIDECIMQSLRAVRILNDNRPETNVSSHFIQGFIVSLLRSTPEMTKQVIGVESNNRRYLWDPSREGIQQFCLRMGEEPRVLTVRNKPMDGRLVRTMILSRIADHHTIDFISKRVDLGALQ